MVRSSSFDVPARRRGATRRFSPEAYRPEDDPFTRSITQRAEAEGNPRVSVAPDVS